jgi:hypothetical protein
MSNTSASILSISLIGSILLYSYLDRRPNQTYTFSSLHFETSVNIHVPDRENTMVEVYDDYVVIVRPDSDVDTIVPMHMVHALDVE